MNATRLIGLMAALCISLPAMAAFTGTSTAAISSRLTRDSDGQHPTANDCLHGSLPCGAGLQESSIAPFSHAIGNTQMGTISGEADATSIDFGRFQGGGGAQVDSYWVDTFTITSATLAPGTPVTLQATVNLHVSSFVPSIAYPAPQTNIFAALNDGGSSCCALAGVFSPGASGDYVSTGSRQYLVGSSVQLVGVFGLQTATHWSIPGDFGKVEGQALYFVDITTPGASYETASGAHYFTKIAAPVPVPASIWMMGIALGTLVVKRRNHPPVKEAV